MSKPPKMRLPYASPQLRLVEAAAEQSAEPTSDLPNPHGLNKEQVIHGAAYGPAQWQQWMQQDANGAMEDHLIGGYQLQLDSGKPLPLDPSAPAFTWESFNLSSAATSDNEFHLLTTALEGLSVEAGVGCSLLTIRPRFSVLYKTQAHAAQLGEIRLLSSSRFVTTADGDQLTLTETDSAGEPVLFLEDQNDRQIVRQQTDWQPQGLEQHYCFDYRVSQPLQKDLMGVAVKSVTVLEQYTSYFMQRPITAEPESSIWVPACAPVTWGWSLRVESEAEDWVITRRKLILPTVGNDGWELPQWQGNLQDYLHPGRE